MPGPGGGGHGGGGGRGGGFGGGGGGFHGGGGRGPGFGGGHHGGHHHHPPHHHHPHHRPYWGGWHFGGWYPRRHYYGGGGCLDILLLPVVLVIFLLVCLLSMCQGNWDVSDATQYQEELFQDYADDQYALHFSKGGAYEDNLLIVVLTEENHSDFYYIAWCGDHLNTDISNKMGNNSTELGRTMNSCINESNYKYSLDSNLAQVMDTMAESIAKLGLEKSFTCEETQNLQYKFVNNTSLSMTESTVESSLQNFCETTGIPVVLVVEDAAEVFVSEDGENSNPSPMAIVAIVIIVVLLIVVFSQKKKPKESHPDR